MPNLQRQGWSNVILDLISLRLITVIQKTISLGQQLVIESSSWKDPPLSFIISVRLITVGSLLVLRGQHCV